MVTIDFADPSTNAYADIDLIAVWFQRKTDPNTFTGNPFIGLFVSEIAVDTNSNPIYLGVGQNLHRRSVLGVGTGIQRQRNQQHLIHRAKPAVRHQRRDGSGHSDHEIRRAWPSETRH